MVASVGLLPLCTRIATIVYSSRQLSSPLSWPATQHRSRLSSSPPPSFAPRRALSLPSSIVGLGFVSIGGRGSWTAPVAAMVGGAVTVVTHPPLPTPFRRVVVPMLWSAAGLIVSCAAFIIALVSSSHACGVVSLVVQVYSPQWLLASSCSSRLAPLIVAVTSEVPLSYGVWSCCYHVVLS